MNTCNFCGLDRGARPMYCSPVCIKRAWKAKRNPHYYRTTNKPDAKFWTTETGKGFKWEKYVADLLGAKHLEFSCTSDLLWKGKTVDVKSSNIFKRKMKRGKPCKGKGNWVFHGSNRNKSDYYFCIALIDDEPQRIFLIPSSEFPNHGITIGWKTKYEKYTYPFFNPICL